MGQALALHPPPPRAEVLLQKKVTDDEFGTSVALSYRIKSAVAVGQVRKRVCGKGKRGFSGGMVFGRGLRRL